MPALYHALLSSPLGMGLRAVHVRAGGRTRPQSSLFGVTGY